MLARRAWRAVGPLLFFGTIAAGLHRAIYPTVVDQDAFYHVKHAWIYRTHGLFDSSFPWAQFSAIRREGADLWYGFHLLLIPFTGGDLLTGLRLGAAVVTVVALALVHSAYARLGLRRPLLWTLLFAGISMDMLFRLLMLRPHPLSLGLLVLLFALLQDATARPAVVGLVTGLIAWMHLALAWIPVVVAAVALPLVPRRGTKAAAVGIGLAVGIFARPNPVGAIRLAWIQVVKLVAVKQLPLRFGVEILPYGTRDFVRELVPISMLLVAALMLFRSTDAERRRPALGALALSVFFFALTFTTARRAAELFVVFAVAFVGLVWTAAPRRGRLACVGIAALVWAAWTTPARFQAYLNAGTYPEDVAEVGAWLRAHARPGELVVHVQWEQFAELFFQDDRLRYVNGMDPIFMYDYDPRLYWEYHHLGDGAGGMTCYAPVCGTTELQNTGDALVDDFHADYVLVDRTKSLLLYSYFAEVRRYEKVFEARGQHLVRLPDGQLAGMWKGETLFRVTPRPSATP